METATFETRAQAPRIVIRDIESISETKQVEELQKEVWGVADREVIPFDQLLVIKEVGGTLVGAFDSDSVVAFVYGFLSYQRDRLQIHSHLLAVKPAYRNLGLGYRLKLAQRERALARGITDITWTFDPLQCQNGYLNFAKLGVLCDRYKVNCYGESTSSFLHQHGTDRLWVTWRLDSVRVRGRLPGDSLGTNPLVETGEAVCLVELGNDDAPCSQEPAGIPGARHVLIEIPGDIGELGHRRPDLAVAWREATRRAFTTTIEAGYLVENFYRHSQNGRRLGVYVLTLGRKVEDFL